LLFHLFFLDLFLNLLVFESGIVEWRSSRSCLVETVHARSVHLRLALVSRFSLHSSAFLNGDFLFWAEDSVLSFVLRVFMSNL
jgi:hypothetical protein